MGTIFSFNRKYDVLQKSGENILEKSFKTIYKL